MHAYAFGTLPPNAAERFHQKKKKKKNKKNKSRDRARGGMLGKVHFSLKSPIYNTAKRGGGCGVIGDRGHIISSGARALSPFSTSFCSYQQEAVPVHP